MKRSEKFDRSVMRPVRTMHRKGICALGIAICICMLLLCLRLGELMLVESEHYQELAFELHTRERQLKAPRGEIVDRNGVVLAANQTVCTVSVVHSQLTDVKKTVRLLAEELGISIEEIEKKVNKVTAREIIRTNVDKAVGDRIRELDLDGVKVDEDYRRYYPCGTMASKVLGFTGADNQGITGLEIKYDSMLKGINGSILTYTDAAGVERDSDAEQRVEPVEGNCLMLTLDYNIQSYVVQVCGQVLEQKEAKAVSCIVMNPKNGEIYAMADLPEFDLNDPFSGVEEGLDEKAVMDALNEKWRNSNISDTYEPGSAFKIITAAAALDAGVVSLEDTFSCPGYYIVEDRRIRCHKTTGHGAETFLTGLQNSCNPVFIQVGLRLGAERFCSYFRQFRLLEKTGIDLPGEAVTIMHRPGDMGDVELATVSFGQSFQLTTLRLLTTVCSIINGGYSITPHLGLMLLSPDRSEAAKFEWKSGDLILEKKVSEVMCSCLEKVVSLGGGKKAYIEGYLIGGKTATSEKLPRGNGRYIAAFVGFAPADDPKAAVIMTIDEPSGIYYGGTIAAPRVREIFENILPYMGIERAT